MNKYSSFSVLFLFAVSLAILTGWTIVRFVDNGDGTVTDTKSNLMWVKIVPQVKRTLSAAEEFAKNTKIGGYRDWRLPTSEELQDIGRAYAMNVFEIRSGEYITSSESRRVQNSMYIIGIYPEKQNVAVYYNGSKRYPFFVWLVRNCHPVQ